MLTAALAHGNRGNTKRGRQPHSELQQHQSRHRSLAERNMAGMLLQLDGSGWRTEAPSTLKVDDWPPEKISVGYFTLLVGPDRALGKHHYRPPGALSADSVLFSRARHRPRAVFVAMVT